jgi:hypothetical protein
MDARRRNGYAPVAGRESGGYAKQGGGSLEGETDEMGFGAEEAVFAFGIGVGACGGGAGGVDVGGRDVEFGGVDGGKKCIQPGYKCFLAHDAGHQHGFGEAGGEKVSVAGLVGGGAVFVFGEEAEGGLVDGGFEGGVGGEVGGVEGEVHGEDGAGWVREVIVESRPLYAVAQLNGSKGEISRRLGNDLQDLPKSGTLRISAWKPNLKTDVHGFRAKRFSNERAGMAAPTIVPKEATQNAYSTVATRNELGSPTKLKPK